MSATHMLIVLSLALLATKASFAFTSTHTTSASTRFLTRNIPIHLHINRPHGRRVAVATAHMFMAASPEDPQVLASGYSQNIDLIEAIQEASDMALAALPMATADSQIDLAIVSISSLYDGNLNSSPSHVVPAFLKAAAKDYGTGIQHLIGSTSGGIVSSRTNSDSGDDKKGPRACIPIEQEGIPGVSVVYCILPDVKLKTFHILGDEVLEDIDEISPDTWKQSVGLDHYQEQEDGNSAFFLLPSPAFKNVLKDFMRGLDTFYPSSPIFGAIASTVSSLSRARLFRHERGSDCIQTLADGCIGVAMTGDLQVQTMIAQGAKPVGGVYKIVKGKESSIQTISLDEQATDLVRSFEEQEVEEEESEVAPSDLKSQMAQKYQKARIPKPVLAEANFVMKALSDDDQDFMRKTILVGIERAGSIPRTPTELARLAEGRGHRFSVHQVVGSNMKEGSVTLPLGIVDMEPGTRMRFYVRESTFAKKEVEALWMGYERRARIPSFTPTGCFLFPTLDRGSKLFLGKPGFESEATAQYLPKVPCVSGFFCNGVIGEMRTDPESGVKESASVHASGSGYILFGSKTGRPIYTPTRDNKEEEDGLHSAAEDTVKLDGQAKTLDVEKRAPRSENGELIWKRREVHSGRALTVSTVEWSVAEKTATPTSTLEGFMWDKETEVDRFRERVPLSNLVSQSRLSQMDPSTPKRRDWIGPVQAAAASSGKFVIIPECKRTEPVTGSLRKRYDLNKLAKEFTVAGVPALSVNCDAVLFGGTLDDITTVREASSKAALEMSSNDGAEAPPIMASDLLLYPYQLYKLSLAGADAVNLIVGALAAKDLVYLTKIASSLKLQTLVSVTSAAQIKALSVVAAGGVNGLIVSNRELEDFSFDMTGQQALDILKSDELKEFKEKHGADIPVLVEGRVGIIEWKNEKGETSAEDYLFELKRAGAIGAIVGGGLVNEEGAGSALKSLMQAS